MKITIEIADPLLDEARVIAASHETTVQALVEEGLRRILVERRARRQFRLRKASFKGKGLHPGAESGSWEPIRDLTYTGRGA